MNLALRRIIAAIFIIGFVISAPILLLYASGYRYNIKKGALQKTGALVINTEPSGAKIYLNGEDARAKTPTRLGNILPDNYEITVEKNGYYSWQKELSVRSQETTFAENIVLFKKTKATPASDQTIGQWNFSPSGAFAIYAVDELAKKYVYLHNLKSGRVRLLSDSAVHPDNLHPFWGKDEKFVLMAGAGAAEIVSTSLPKRRVELKYADIGFAPRRFRWSKEQPNQLYFSGANAIYQYTFNETSKRIFTSPTSGELLDFFISGDVIYALEKISDNAVLTKYNVAGETEKMAKSITMDILTYEIVGLFNDRLAIHDATGGAFALVSPGLDGVSFHANDIQHATLLAGTQKLLLQSDKEIILLEPNQTNPVPKTITRYSAGLADIRWHAGANYLYARQSGNIHIIELDDRNGHFTITLPIENAVDFTVTPDDDALYFIKNKQLWTLGIEEKGFFFE